MFAFAVSLIRPYWNRMAALFAAMLVETAMGLATLWPLSIVLDSVFDTRPLARGVSWLMGSARTPMGAAIATLAIALLQAVSSYLTAYNTVSVGQSIAHELRQSVYTHLQRLSMSSCTAPITITTTAARAHCMLPPPLRCP